jgi:hypothetical protein
LEAGLIDASSTSALGCFLLNVAANVEGARTDPELLQMVEPLGKLATSCAAGAAGAAAVEQLRVLFAGVSSASEDTVEGGKGVQGRQGGGGMVALEDLAAAAGGRHDNDHADYRDIKVMVTSEEVRECL